MLNFDVFCLGTLENNTYLLTNPNSDETVIIDPSFGSRKIMDTIVKRNLQLRAIWLTHAHFDHIAGIPEILSALASPVPVLLHPADLPLWQHRGGADQFGFTLGTLPDDPLPISHGEKLTLGDEIIQVLHTPGHTRGGVAFYSQTLCAAFTGDAIFYHSIGRTDLPGGDTKTLLHSIRSCILTLPPDTMLISGHGDPTTVEEELVHNPYL